MVIGRAFLTKKERRKKVDVSRCLERGDVLIQTRKSSYACPQIESMTTLIAFESALGGITLVA
jgi:hypothetical protein